MSANVEHFTTQDETVTTGWTPERLAELTWDDVKDVSRLARTALIRDLDRYDIRPQVRLNPGALSRFKKGAKSLMPEIGGGFRYVLTDEWQSVKPAYAFLLHTLRAERPDLGAESMEDVLGDDGYGGKTVIQRRKPGVPDLFEFRMPADASLVLATA